MENTTTWGQPKVWAEQNNSDSSRRRSAIQTVVLLTDVSPRTQKQSSNQSSVSEIKQSTPRSLSMKCLAKQLETTLAGRMWCLSNKTPANVNISISFCSFFVIIGGVDAP